MHMKIKFHFLLLATAFSCVSPTPAKGQVVDNAVKAIGGLFDVFKKDSNTKSKEKKVKGKVYDEVDVKPQFPGGKDAFINYLSNNLKYPIVAEENNIEGRVVVSFVINKNGEIAGCEIQESSNSLFDKEALRVVGEMPKWTPGTIKGKAVNVRYSIPINFALPKKNSPLSFFMTKPLPSLNGLDLIIVDKGIVNLRNKSNGTKRTSYGEPITLEGFNIYSAKIFPSGWAFLPKYRHPDGFISPTVFHNAKNKPFEEWMFNSAEAYIKRNDGTDVFWRIGTNKDTELTLVERNYYKIDGITLSELSIGRIDNNLYYPLHQSYINIVYKANAENITIKTIPSEHFGGTIWQIIYNKAYAINTNRGIRIDLEKIPIAILEKLFCPIPDYVLGDYMEMDIPAKESDVLNLYSGLDYFEGCINAELMSPPYVDKNGAINAFQNKGEIPNVQTKHMKFLGLELGGNAKQFERALRNKGFVDGDGFGMDDIYLKGNVYGQTSQVRIVVEDGIAKAIHVIDTANSSAAAKKRCSVYKQHLVADYGQGKTPYAGKYEIDLPYGTAYYESGAFDSGMYELMMYIGEK